MLIPFADIPFPQLHAPPMSAALSSNIYKLHRTSIYALEPGTLAIILCAAFGGICFTFYKSTKVPATISRWKHWIAFLFHPKCIPAVVLTTDSTILSLPTTFSFEIYGRGCADPNDISILLLLKWRMASEDEVRFTIYLRPGTPEEMSRGYQLGIVPLLHELHVYRYKTQHISVILPQEFCPKEIDADILVSEQSHGTAMAMSGFIGSIPITSQKFHEEQQSSTRESAYRQQYLETGSPLCNTRLVEFSWTGDFCYIPKDYRPDNYYHLSSISLIRCRIAPRDSLRILYQCQALENCVFDYLDDVTTSVQNLQLPLGRVKRASLRCLKIRSLVDIKPIFYSIDMTNLENLDLDISPEVCVKTDFSSVLIRWTSLKVFRLRGQVTMNDMDFFDLQKLHNPDTYKSYLDAANIVIHD